MLAALLLSSFLAVPLVLDPAEAPVAPFLSAGTLYTKGEIAFFVAIPSETSVKVEVNARGQFAEGAWPLFAITVDQAEAARHTADDAGAKTYQTNLDLSPGVHRIGVRMLNEAGGFFSRRSLALGQVILTPENEALALKPSDEATWLKEGPRREQQTLMHAREQLKTARMADASVRFVGKDGERLAGAKVEVALERHAFLFGGLIAGFNQYPTPAQNEEYRDRFRELFNYATVPFYWRLFEKKQGAPLHAEKEQMIDWCRENGMAVKGHPLLWGHEAGIPEWSKGQPGPALQEKFVRDTMTHYRQRVNLWEVVNEPVNQPEVALMPAHAWAREADSEAGLVINEYGIFYESYPEFFTLLQDAIRDKVPFDAIGIQAHAPTDMAFPLDRVWRILDWYSQLGKPIHITEFTPPSLGDKLTGAVWRGAWSERTQAEYAEDFYRVCFAHPAVKAITWWDFTDTGAWVPGGGLLRHDRTPKPAYERLKKLIQEEWRTRETLTTDQEGRAQLHGFRGTYTARHDNDTVHFSFDGADVTVSFKE